MLPKCLLCAYCLLDGVLSSIMFLCSRYLLQISALHLPAAALTMWVTPMTDSKSLTQWPSSLVLHQSQSASQRCPFVACCRQASL